MAGRRTLTVCLPREDRRWLTGFAREADVSVDAAVIRAVQHLRGWQETGRKALKEVLACIDDVFREHEQQLRAQRQYYERQIKTERARVARLRTARINAVRISGVYGNALYSQKVSKLLALAISSDSEDEASAAFARARALHRLAAL